MDRVAPDQLAQTILSAPAWARVGITAPDELMREEAALELARSILGEDYCDDPRLLALML